MLPHRLIVETYATQKHWRWHDKRLGVTEVVTLIFRTYFTKRQQLCTLGYQDRSRIQILWLWILKILTIHEFHWILKVPTKFSIEIQYFNFFTVTETLNSDKYMTSLPLCVKRHSRGLCKSENLRMQKSYSSMYILTMLYWILKVSLNSRILLSFKRPDTEFSIYGYRYTVTTHYVSLDSSYLNVALTTIHHLYNVTHRAFQFRQKSLDSIRFSLPIWFDSASDNFAACTLIFK